MNSRIFFKKLQIGLIASPCTFLAGAVAYLLSLHTWPPLMPLVSMFACSIALINLAILEKAITLENFHNEKWTLSSVTILVALLMCTFIFFFLGVIVTRFLLVFVVKITSSLVSY
jgi:hypothetical protein